MVDRWWNWLWPRASKPRPRLSTRRRFDFDRLEDRVNPVLFEVNVTYDALVPINPGDVTLRSAINASNISPGLDVINFVGPAAGANITMANLLPIVNGTGVSYFAINDALIINGSTGSGNTTISGSGVGRFLTLEAAASNLNLSNTTLSGFNALGFNGGAINLTTGTLTLSNLRLANNLAGSGGGLAISGGSSSLSSVVFQSNTASVDGGGLLHNGGGYSVGNLQFNNNIAGARGGGAALLGLNGGYSIGTSTGNSANAGGLVAVDGGNMTFDGTTFAGNSAAFGGGISVGFTAPTTVNLNNSIVRNNTATSIGGGAHIGVLGNLAANGTVFGGLAGNGNSAPSGGGIFNSGTAGLTRVTIANNSATSSGSGLASNAGIVGLTDSTVSSNPGPGGLFFSAGVVNLINNTIAFNGNAGVQQTGGFVAMGNTIVANNTGVDFFGSFNSLGNNLIGNTNGIVVGPIGSDLVNVNPLLSPTLAANGAVAFPSFTHALQQGSPALNAGNNANAVSAGLTTDQRSSSRFVQTVDIGAYELIDTVSPTGVLTPPPNITAAQAATNTIQIVVTYTDTAGGGFESPSGVNTATFGINDITVSNGATVTSILPPVGNQVTYIVSAPAANWGASFQGTYTISLTNGGVTDRLGNPIVGIPNFGSFVVDTVRPTASLTTPPVNINSNSVQTTPNQFVVTFSEPVTGTAAAFTATNGATVTFLMAVGNVVTYQVSPPSGSWDTSPQGVYTISLVAGSVADAVGNTNLGVSPFTSFSVNTIRPFATLTGQPANITVANATPGTNSFTITYSTLGAPLDPSTFGANDVTVTNNTNSATLTVISASASGNVVTYTVQATGGLWSTLPQSTYTIALNANTVFDTAGNSVAANPTIGFFFVDVYRPTATLTTPAPDINLNYAGPPTNTFTITYADIGQGIDTSTLGTGNVTVTGPATLTVSTAMVVGNVVTYTVLAPNNDWSTAPAGTYTVGVVAGNVLDLAGNGILANANFDFFIVDLSRPTATLTTPPPNINAANAAPGTNSFTITYADVGSGIDPASFGTSDVTVTSGMTTLTVTGFVAMGNAVTYTVTAPANNWNNVLGGTYTVALNANAVFDNAGNPVAANSSIASFTVDVTNPTVVVSPTGTLSNASPILFTLTFSEPVTGLTTAGITITNGTAGTLTANSASIYTLQVTPAADGPVTVTVNAAAAQDASGNPSLVSNTAIVQSDRTGPVATFSQPSSLTTVSGPISYTITWADPNFSAVTLTPGQVIVNGTGTAGATVASVTGTGNTRVVTLANIFGNGTISISLPSGVAVDTLGNPSAAAGPSPTFTVNGTRILSIAQSPAPATVLPGTTYVTTITYSNTGTQISPNTTISVNLAAGTFAPASSTPGWTGSGSNYTYSLGTLAQGASGQLTFGVAFAAKTAPGTKAVITATIQNAIGDTATSTVSFLVVDANRPRWGRCC